MKNRAARRRLRHSAPSRNPDPHAFAPVPVQPRRDGWTPGRQVAFVHALAATGCVADACAAVGMSPRSYYDLRTRPGSDSFRRAVDAATDVGAQRLEDALFERALRGEVVPVFHRGEQVGERRRYDNRLALALLRARNGDRYGRWRDGVQQVRGNPDGAALLLAEAARRLAEDGRADLAGRPRPERAPLPTTILATTGDDEEDDALWSPAVAAGDAYERGDTAYADELMRQLSAGIVPPRKR